MSHYENHVSIEINSRRRTRGSIEEFTTHLGHQITFSQKQSKSYFMRLENIQIPKSYYDIDSNFNVFRVIETGGTYNVTISPGKQYRNAGSNESTQNTQADCLGSTKMEM